MDGTEVEEITVEIFSRAVNANVLRVPERAYPGVLIQGDSLRLLYDSARTLELLCTGALRPEDAEATPVELATELREALASYLWVYQSALDAHGRPVPEAWRVTQDDLTCEQCREIEAEEDELLRSLDADPTAQA
jgi:hypothetical protein